MKVEINTNRMMELVSQFSADSENNVNYIRLSLPRINFTIEQLQKYDLMGKRVCEIGFGAIGLACQLQLGARVDAYDISDTYKPVCEHLGIPWGFLDISKEINVPENLGKYDFIIFCEVIEHIARSPVDILREIRSWLKPGGVLVVSTVNLVRLSNRLRMLMGKEIFARYEPGAFVMEHHREYTIEEMRAYLEAAGYAEVAPYFYSQPDLRYPFLIQQSYLWVARLFPGLANLTFAFARNPG